jgi:hypothetical protein
LTSEFLRRLSLLPPDPVGIVRRMRGPPNENDAEWMRLSTSSHQFHLECAAAGISYSEIGNELALIVNHLNGTGAAPDVAVPLHSLPYPTAREQSGLVRAAAAAQTATFQRAFELLFSDPIAFMRWGLTILPLGKEGTLRVLERYAQDYERRNVKQRPQIESILRQLTEKQRAQCAQGAVSSAAAASRSAAAAASPPRSASSTPVASGRSAKRSHAETMLGVGDVQKAPSSRRKVSGPVAASAAGQPQVAPGKKSAVALAAVQPARASFARPVPSTRTVIDLTADASNPAVAAAVASNGPSAAVCPSPFRRGC